ncbi:cid13, partial [Symbiodinium pilosum]
MSRLPWLRKLSRAGSSTRQLRRPDSRCFSTTTELPVLEHGQLYGDLPGFARSLGTACRVGEGGAGCFLISQLPPHINMLHQELLQSARDFFALPLAKKERVDYHLSPEFRGFMRQGAENTAGHVDEREQIEFGREEARPTAGREDPSSLYNRLR